ncbi:serine protease inhibitor dipetalogastin-like isoform X2 [Cydia pomonella]|uniref:serine protease inhibitor dipetalogastin-like isoform X2 n=1 Tax=Cydia pomonella TaxID=82600 RepID=UPI002ADD6E20|nr:serine protease inhibitor dipetalogastin-like isoform X2 [Cydia pomonella]
MILAVFVLTFGILDGVPLEQGCCDPTTCKELVCGSDFKTYRCLCELECVDYYSEPGIMKVPLYKVHNGDCIPLPCDCTPDPTGPFCGNDSLTYFSECVFYCTKSSTIKMYDGPCNDETNSTVVS